MTTRVIQPTIRIGLQPRTKALRLERNVAGPNRTVGSWCIWISAAADYNTGTYLKLYDDGTIERVTLYDDGHEEVFTVKGPDHYEGQ